MIWGGQKVTRHGKKVKKNKNQDAKWNKKMGGRIFVITCGIIGTLYYTALYSVHYTTQQCSVVPLSVL